MLKLSEATVRRILAWAEGHPTIEVTGMVAEGPQGQRVRPMRNIARQPDRYYEWDPEEMGDAYSEMGARAEEPIAFYHSHPSGKPDPSERDMEGALHEGMHYVIAYPEHSCPSGSTGWRLSVWECLEMGILVESSYEVGP